MLSLRTHSHNATAYGVISLGNGSSESVPVDFQDKKLLNDPFLFPKMVRQCHFCNLKITSNGQLEVITKVDLRL